MDFSPSERDAVYRAIRERRDVRSDFLMDPIPDDVLGRILSAAHQAPSVGLMQPWDFLIVKDQNARERIKQHVDEAKQRSNIYEGDRRDLYSSLKLDGIVDSALNICVTCDGERSRGHGLGRRTDPAVASYSTACAVQNLWLAARVEGVGVGWVSILEPEKVKEILSIPNQLRLVAYLCVGYVRQFRERPELEQAGWESRSPLMESVHFERWGNRLEVGPGNPA